MILCIWRLGINGLHLHKVVTFPCPDCESTFTRKDSCQKHIKSVHEGATFPCKDCVSTFTREVNLKKHIKSAHKL